MKTKFTSINKIKDLHVGFKTGTVDLLTKDKKPVTFFLKEIDPADYFKLKGFAGAAKRATENKKELDIAGNFSSGLEMSVACLTDEKGKSLIEDLEQILEFLNDSFSVEQLSNLIEKMMDLCGFSKTAVKSTEKN